jgi:putative endonuclease
MKKQYDFWIYITTNWKKTTLYVGFTKNLKQRLKEHYDNRGKPETFAGKYYCYNLVYSEWHQYVYNAIARENELKGWSREKKEQLITEFNPDWKFSNKDFCGEWPPAYEGRL